MTSDACRRWIAEGDRHRDGGEPAKAAEAYRRALAIDPLLGFVQVQLGNMLKDTGRYNEAEEAYRAALACGADAADTNLQLGRALRMAGRRDAALVALTASLKAAPHGDDTVRELISLGDAWTVQQQRGLGAGAIAEAVAALDGIRATLGRIEKMLPQVASLAAIPPSRWDLWCRLWQPPPSPPAGPPIGLVVLAEGVPLPALLASIASIERQQGGLAGAVFVTTEADARDTVARHAVQARVTLRAVEPPKDGGLAGALDAALADAVLADAGWIALADQPLILAAGAACWLSAATGVALPVAGVFTDEDTVDVDLERPITEWPHRDQVLKGAADPERIAQGLDLGSLVVVPRSWLATKLADGTLATSAQKLPYPLEGPAAWLALHASLLAAGPLTHIPHVIVSREGSIRAAREADAGPAAGTVAVSTSHRPASRSFALPSMPALFRKPFKSIDVIVPTRDRADLLAPCLTSLRATAEQPNSIVVTVVDNGSEQANTTRFLAIAQADGLVARIIRSDAPFNWSALNNQAVAQSDSPLLVFANNDIEMLSAGWDERLRAHLARADISVVGARLLYGNRTVQHAGIVLGTEGGGSEHEGRGASADDPGPDGRWLTRRSVAAVTGAFLACRRADFGAVGGFDAQHFGIWFNDVDFCLKQRSRGSRVIYEPAIEAYHYESKTLAVEFRDHSRSAHFEAALAAMRERWGSAFAHDPYFNPHYARWGTPFAWLRPPAGRL